MLVGETRLDAAAEAGIDEKWFLLNNQQTCNALINGKYMSNIIDDPDWKYLIVHFNAGVSYTNKIGYFSGYSNAIWYNPKEITNTLSLVLVQKHHISTYNSQYGNAFVIHSPQRPTSNTTKAGFFYHNMRQLLKIRIMFTSWLMIPYLPYHKWRKIRNNIPPAM